MSLPSVPNSLNLSTSRIPPWPGLPLHTLTLTCDYRNLPILSKLCQFLLPLLNPTRLQYDVRDARTAVTFPLFTTPLLLNFSRLEEIDFKGTLTYRPGISPRSLASRRSHPWTAIESFESISSLFLRRIATRRRSCGYFAPESLSWIDRMQEGTLVLVVETEEKKVQAELAVIREVEERWRGKFVVELEEKV